MVMFFGADALLSEGDDFLYPKEYHHKMALGDAQASGRGASRPRHPERRAALRGNFTGRRHVPGYLAWRLLGEPRESYSETYYALISS